MNRQKIENSTVLITGSNSGIGRELALELVKNNTVIICGRDQSKLEAVQNLDPRLIIRQCDIALYETEIIQDYYFLMDALRDSKIYTVPYFEIVDIFPAIEEGFLEYAASLNSAA
ncbi:MAG: SDR family NAD(P)-dependent oxidoreductase [Pseudomonadales bacterium]|nr:SDR family NAD(P)-dependent oxidoreductase [Pseudomonadales bacterium]NRA14593.1 SDR family NAD(P)-dependent oxidoreductase [Oceanospirillaceae bacterium]